MLVNFVDQSQRDNHYARPPTKEGCENQSSGKLKDESSTVNTEDAELAIRTALITRPRHDS